MAHSAYTSISSQPELAKIVHKMYTSLQTKIVSVNIYVSHRLSHILWNPSSCMLKQACVEPPSSALNMMLPAFAADCPCLHNTSNKHAHGYQSISPASWALSSKPASSLLLLSIDGTDRWTDTRPLHRPCSAHYTGSINNAAIQRTLDVCMTLRRPKGVRPTCWIPHALR